MPLSLLSQSRQNYQCIVCVRTLEAATITWATCGFLDLYRLPAAGPTGELSVSWDECLRQIPSLTGRHLVGSLLRSPRQQCTLGALGEGGGWWEVSRERLDQDHVLLDWRPVEAHDFDLGRQISYEALHGLPNPVFIKDHDHRWVYGNTAFCELLSLGDPAGILGKSDYDFFPQEQALRFWTIDEAVFHEQRSITVEEPVTLADGREKWLLTQKIPIDLPRGDVGLLGIISDITKIKVVEHQKDLNRKFYQKIESATGSKGRFLTNMSHELRTPLNAVIGYTELLQDDLDVLPEEEVREDLAKISAAAYHLLDLVNSVLDLSQGGNGELPLNYENVELGSLFKSVTHYVHSMVNHATCTFSVKVPQSPVWAEADVTRLRQVLLNLLSNAVKFTERGAIKATLWVEGEDFLVEVADTGPGISQDKWVKVFEPFERLEMHDSLIEGSGLGLSISRQLAHMMGGDIGLHSTPGQGSTFTLRLPLFQGPRVQQSHEEVSEVLGYASKRLDLPTVLIIDDDPSVPELITRFAAQQPVEILWAADPIQGCKVALDHTPALILLDLVFPNTSGWDVLERLKTDPRTADIPVVIVSFLASQHGETPAQRQTPRVQKPLSRNRWNELLKANMTEWSECA